MDMQYRKAALDEAERVCYIVKHTFGRLHSIDNIIKDIGRVEICVLVKNSEIIGTGSYTDNHITRV